METHQARLIELCQKGQLENFAELYDLYAKKIYAFLYYRTGHRQTAEDLASLTFMKALERIKTFNPNKGAFQTWLYQIARNSLIDHYKTHTPHEDIEAAAGLTGPQNVAAETEARLNLEKVKNFLSTLEPDKRDVVIMRVWDGLSYREIAEITGRNEAALKMTFSRVMARLHQETALAALYLLLLKNTF